MMCGALTLLPGLPPAIAEENFPCPILDHRRVSFCARAVGSPYEKQTRRSTH